MSAIHTKLTGKEDSYEQAVREAGEREIPEYHAAGIAATDPETMTPNHPDYMRLVVHQMD